MKDLKYLAVGIMCSVSSACCWADTADAASRPKIDADGTIHVPAFSVPLSRYMSDEARRKFIEAAGKQTGASDQDKPASQLRAEADDYVRPLVARARSRYPVNVADERFGGVSVQVVTPKEGIAADNANRVLINLHGGSFIVGAGLVGLAESIPVAARGGIKVVTVDYRMAPEHRFPAASRDVAAVYSELLKRYEPENVGIYGCSAGGILSAMTVAWLQKEKLPTPGAIGIFSAGAYSSFSGPPSDANTWGGDSSFIAPPLVGEPAPPADGTWRATIVGAMDYTRNVDKQDPLASPALSPALLAKFPPTLLITGTRAWDMSAAVQTQRLLTKAGVRADLHLWDGMGHCFLFDADLPESQEAYDVITNFFATHLGRRAR